MAITRRTALRALCVAVLAGGTGRATYPVLKEACQDMFAPSGPGGLDSDRRSMLEKIFFNRLAHNVGEKIPAFAGLDQSCFTELIGTHAHFRISTLKVSPDDDMAAIRSIMRILRLSDDFREHNPRLTTESPNSAVYVASPVTNPHSRRIFFESTAPNRPFDLIMHGSRFALKYNFSTHTLSPRAPKEVRRWLGGSEIEEPNHTIVSRDHKIYKSHLTRTGYPEDGYLLFSKLPHPRFRNHTVAVWSGNIGPATEATRIIVESMSEDALKKLMPLSGKPYFQILWRADQIYFDRTLKRHMPGKVSLVSDGVHVVNEYQD